MRPMSILTLVAALGSGLVAGVLFAFSTSVMPGLRTLPAEQGIVVMRRLDTAITNPVFITVYAGTALLSVASAAMAVLRRSRRGAAFLLAGGLLYLANVVITRVVHLPRNAALHLTDPAGEHSANWWAEYMTTWTTWNHVRMLVALAGAAAFAVSLVRQGTRASPGTDPQR